MSALAEIGNRIKTAHRDVRATAGGVDVALSRLRLAALGTRFVSQIPVLPKVSKGWVRVTRFAQALLGRYQGRLEHKLRFRFVFRQLQPSVIVRPGYYRTQVHLAPRLELTVLAGETAPDQPQPRLKPAIRGGRIEAMPTGTRTVARPGLGDTAQVIAAPQIPPVPRVVRRPVTATTAETTSAVSGRRPVLGGVEGSPVMGEPSQGVPRPVDVNRLTDQVIQAIDRRIIAQRERLGRV